MSGQEKTKLAQDRRTQKALKILHVLISRYYHKFPGIDPTEFESAGYVGIAAALKKFIKGNFPGYVKIAIQNEFRGFLRWYKKQEDGKEKIRRIVGKRENETKH